MSLDGNTIAVKIAIYAMAGVLNILILSLFIGVWNSNPGFLKR